MEVAAPEYKWYKFEILTRDAQQVLGSPRPYIKDEGKTVMLSRSPWHGGLKNTSQTIKNPDDGGGSSRVQGTSLNYLQM